MKLARDQGASDVACAGGWARMERRQADGSCYDLVSPTPLLLWEPHLVGFPCEDRERVGDGHTLGLLGFAYIEGLTRAAEQVSAARDESPANVGQEGFHPTGRRLVRTLVPTRALGDHPDRLVDPRLALTAKDLYNALELSGVAHHGCKVALLHEDKPRCCALATRGLLGGGQTLGGA